MKKLLLVLAAIAGTGIAASAQTILYSENFSGNITGWTTNIHNNTLTWEPTTASPVSNYPGASGGQYARSAVNINMVDAKILTLNSNISTVGYRNIKVMWAAKRNNGATQPLTFAFSTDNGTTFTTVTNWTDNTTSDNIWRLANEGTAISLPAGAENATNLVLSWSIATHRNSNQSYGLDDLIITGEPLAGTTTFSFDSRPAGENPFIVSSPTAATPYSADGISIYFSRSSTSGVNVSTASVSGSIFQTPKRTLTLIQNGANTSTRTTTITTLFSAPVKDLSFTIFDVDRNAGQFQDVLRVEGFLNGTAVTLGKKDVITTSNNEYAGSNIIRGLPTGTDVATNSAEGNVTITFPSTVDRVQITYMNGDAAMGTQGIAISDISWTVPSSSSGFPALPVELSSFSGKMVNAAAELKWTTASEKDNNHFEVERSQDGRNFETIGEVKGKGNSKSASSYSFTDQQPMSGVNYYRLKQVDFDGQSEYSGVIALRHKATATRATLSVYPNPATTELNIELKNGSSEGRTISIRNMAGTVVKQIRTEQITLPARVTVEDLPAGIYVVQLEGSNSSEYVRFIKK